MTYYLHNRKSLRIKGYNYAAEGFYFITICTFDRQHLFGEIENKHIKLNDAGKIAKQCWELIPIHCPNTKIHDFVIMPDHIHGIIEILYESDGVGANDDSPLLSPNHSPLPMENYIQKFESPKKTIGSVIRGFKIGVTKWMREFTPHHQIWQRNYYEHIIRDQQSYDRICFYINSNPENWKA
ncbi:MAG: transposase [Bacteroidota bacterium]